VGEGGALGLDPEVLGRLDWSWPRSIRAAAPTARGSGGNDWTDRLVRAMESGVVDCIAHPTGRLLGRRAAAPLDLERILCAARRLGVAVALDASPERLDLDAASCRRAASSACPSSSARARTTGRARRARVSGRHRAPRLLEPGHVLNAGPLEEMWPPARPDTAGGDPGAGEGARAGRAARGTGGAAAERLRRALEQRPLPEELASRLRAWLEPGATPSWPGRSARSRTTPSGSPSSSSAPRRWPPGLRPRAPAHSQHARVPGFR